MKISREKTIVVELHIGGEQVVVNCSEDGGDWDLGYCITVHKSQGSEWPVVVVLVGNGYGDQQVAGREWLYTAISRGKKVTVLIGHNFQIEAAVKQRRIWERKSMMLKYWGVKNETSEACLDNGNRYEGATALDVGQPDDGNREKYPLLVPADAGVDTIAW